MCKWLTMAANIRVEPDAVKRRTVPCCLGDGAARAERYVRDSDFHNMKLSATIIITLCIR